MGGVNEIEGKGYHDHDVDDALSIVDWIYVPVACCSV